DASLRAIEEPCAQMLFQLLDLEGDRRLRHEERLGRLGERQVLRYRVEHLQAPVGHAADLTTRSGIRGRSPNSAGSVPDPVRAASRRLRRRPQVLDEFL